MTDFAIQEMDFFTTISLAPFTRETNIIITRMNVTHLRHVTGVTLIVFSLLLVTIVNWPNRRDIRKIEFPSNSVGEPGSYSQSRGSLWINIPREAWVRQTISLPLKLDFVNTPGYQTTQSRVDLPGTRLSPNGTVTRGITSGETVNFLWKIEVLSQGEIEGTIWIYLSEPVSENQLAPKTELLAAIPIQFVSKSILGMGWKDIQVLSAAFLILGLSMIYEFFLKLLTVHNR